MNIGRELTDKELEKLEKALAREYRTAKKEMQQKLDKFTKKYQAADNAQRGLLRKGTISKEQYETWRKNQILRSSWIKGMIESYAQDQVNTNKAAATLINNLLPNVYAENHNFGTFQIESMARVDTSYTLHNRESVARLLKDNPKLLPEAKISVPKDKRWNQQKMQSMLTQGILQGESIPQIADRLQGITDMNRASAIRNARTMVTGAENAGKLDSYRRAESIGIKLKKMWSATMDDRTRDSHAFLDGVTVPIEEEFPNGCMYPGDPGGPGDEVWNCRCDLSSQLDGFERDMTDLVNRNTDHFDWNKYEDYEKWKNVHTDRAAQKAVRRYYRQSGYSAPTEYINKYKGVGGGDYAAKKFKSLTTKDNGIIEAYRIACDAEPQITSELKRITSSFGARFSGLEARLKEGDSFARKIFETAHKRGTSTLAEGLKNGDTIRYTIVSETKNYTTLIENANKTLANNGYKLVDLSNCWINDGIAMNSVVAYYEHPSGQLFEVMFHTKESKKVIDTYHQYYETLRWKDSTKLERMLCDKKLSDAYGTNPVPKGIERIKHVKGIYNGKYSGRYGR